MVQRPNIDRLSSLCAGYSVIDVCPSLPYIRYVFTVIETPTFTRLWPDYWTEDERGEFVAWLAAHPEAGDVVRGSGGCRKVRWSRPGKGKRGGVRVIHYNRLPDGVIYLLLIYAKGVRDSIPSNVLKQIRETIDAEDE